MANTQLEHQTSEVTVPRQPIEDFLLNSIEQLMSIEADSDESRRGETIRTLIQSFQNNLAIVRHAEEAAVTQRVRSIEARIENGDLPPAHTADEIDAKFAAYLAK